MQFTSLGFLLLLPVVMLLDAVIPARFRYILLAAVSLGFYFFLDWKSGIAMVCSILLTYCAGLLIERIPFPAKEPSRGQSSRAGGRIAAALVLAVPVIISAGLMFVLRSDSILGAIGISFYMLKAIGYMADVFRGETDAERNILKYSLFVSFFPQIICGPIERAGNMLPQFDAPRDMDFYRLRYGFLQIVWGFFLKFVIADRLALFVNSVYSDPGIADGSVVFLATVFYSFEIYCDFAGYSDIAIGASTLLGIDVMKNFDSPYMSKSVSEFWRRWHISLSSWLKDYIYIPLGGNRKGVVRKYINILIVFAISGIWHGTALTFIVWGLLHAVYQILGYILTPARDWFVKKLDIRREGYSHKFVKTVATFFLINIAWIFFRADTLQTALFVLKKSFVVTPWVLTDGSLFDYGLDAKDFNMAMVGLLMLVIHDVFNHKKMDLTDKLLKEGIWFRWGVTLLLIMMVLIFGIWGPGYEASTFIYQQF